MSSDRGRQVIRLWKLLRLLEARHTPASIATLHAELADLDEPCSTRTVRRDLAALEAAGFPLVEAGGRWRTLTNSETGGSGKGAWSLPLHPSQVVALFLAESTFADLPFAEPLHELRDRLEVLLPPQTRAACREFASQLKATPAAPVQLSDHKITDILQRAIRERRCLRLGYASPKSGSSERILEPQLLWHAATGFYLVGRDPANGQQRTFALQRIRTVVLLDQHFTADPDFNPDDYVRRGFGVYHGPVYDITIDITATSAYLVRERRYHPSQRLEEREDGSIRAHWTMAGLPEIARWIASFGGNATVVAPVELRERVRELHRKGLASNAGEV